MFETFVLNLSPLDNHQLLMDNIFLHGNSSILVTNMIPDRFTNCIAGVSENLVGN